MRRSFGIGVLLLLAFGLAACGTTVPLSQQAGLGASGASGPASAQLGAGGSGSAGTSSGGGSGASGSVGSAGASGAATTGNSTVSASSNSNPTGAGAGAGASTGSGTATGSGSTPVPGSPAAIPATGRGWDAKNVYIGIPTSDDANAAFAAAGANFDNGSIEGDANAVVADINKAGGLFGRTVVPAYYNIPIAQYEANTSAAIQSVCSYYTQDRPVIAVISPAPQFDSSSSFHKCMQQYGTALISASNTDYDNKDYAQLGPYLWSIASLSSDTLIPSWIAALEQQGYFSGWNTVNGGAGSTPTKVGLLLADDPQGHYVASLLLAELKQLGINVASQFFYDPSGSGTDNQSEVLQFKAAGVTHVMDLPPVELEVAEFQSAAEQQHYRPRYAITSFDLPLTVEQNSAVAPPVQQVGSVGIGWQPLNDTDAQHGPGPTPGQDRCLADLAAGGQTFDATHRRAATVGEWMCDSLFLIQQAVLAGGGYTGADMLAGMTVGGTKIAPAATFLSGLSSTDHGLPGAYRDLQYQASCSCFEYVGGDHPFTS